MKIKVEVLASESSPRFGSERGFTIVQSLVTVALVALISAFAVMAVGSARASMRLTGSTREFAGYLEKARSNAIRRNGEAVITILDETSYSVTMDFDADGTVETRTIRLQQGVTFDGVVGVTARFDWRGRLGGPIRFVLRNDRDLTSDVQLSGSGDVTIGNEAFEDHDIGAVVLNSNVPGGSPTPFVDTPPGDTEPSPTPVSTPPNGNPQTSPTPYEYPSPTTNPSPSASPGASPGASPSGSPSASPTSSPSQGVCTLTAPSSVTLPKNGSPKSFSGVSITNANMTLIAATTSGDISAISPASTTLSGNGSITYTITYANGTNKSGSVKITSTCGTKVIQFTFN